jgi:hypothetical protein
MGCRAFRVAPCGRQKHLVAGLSPRSGRRGRRFNPAHAATSEGIHHRRWRSFRRFCHTRPRVPSILLSDRDATRFKADAWRLTTDATADAGFSRPIEAVARGWHG